METVSRESVVGTVAPPRYQRHVDGLRAIAVLIVLLFHLGVRGFGGGFVGVDVFLVISGFLITRLIKDELDETGSFRFGRFYLRRARRLAPALLCTLVCSMIAAALLFSSESLRRFGAEFSVSIFSVSNLYFWMQADYFDVAASMRALLHMWSLSVEEQFYLFWPATMVLVFRGSWRARMPLLLMALIAVSLFLNFPFGSGIAAGSTILPDAFADGKQTIFYLLPFRVFEFGLGALMVWMQPSPCLAASPETRLGRWMAAHSVGVADLECLTALALIGTATYAFDSALLFPSFYALMPCVGAALAIHAGDRSRLSCVLTNRVCVGLGLISYSLYLVHWPLIVFWEYTLGPLSWRERVLIGGLSIVLATLSHRFIEQPFRSGRVRLRWLVPVVLVMLALSVSMWKTSAWAWRSVAHGPIEVRGGAEEFHRRNYGGADYPRRGAVETAFPPDLLLVGDSHGMQYAEGVYSELAGPRGLALHIIAGTSCFNLPGFTRTTEGQDWDAICPGVVDSIIALSQSCERKPVLVLSHSWYSQLRNAALLDSDGVRSAARIGVPELIEGIARLKTAAGVEHVLVLDQVPTSGGINLYDELTRPPLFQRKTLEEILAPKPLHAAFAEFNRLMRKAADDAAGTAGSFVFLDPCDALCRDGLCDSAEADGELLYSDGGHLSKAGSRRVIRAFLPEFLQAVGDRLGADGQAIRTAPLQPTSPNPSASP